MIGVSTLAPSRVTDASIPTVSRRTSNCREFSMPSARPSTADKRKTFRELHKSGCFVIPNPWNVGSARYLQGLGFKAIASTSSGHAHSQGYADGAQSRDEVLAHFKEIAAAADIPLNADFGNGFADDPDTVAGMGVRRISVGGTLARVAMDAFIKSARAIATEGKFDSFAGIISNQELNKFFADDRKN